MSLEVVGVDCGYGPVPVLRGVTFELASGEVLGLLGRNGAGKTTTLRAIMGLTPPQRGSIRLDGEELTRVPGHLVARHGVAYVPQGRRLFPGLTVAENLRLGRLAGGRESSRASGEALDLFPDLRDRLDQPAGTLSGGQQQMAAMARALSAGPKVLLLDEPTEGLMPNLVEKLLETVLALRARGVAVLLVEQKVPAALRVADRLIFLENGQLRGEFTRAALGRDPAPLERYLGVRGRAGEAP